MSKTGAKNAEAVQKGMAAMLASGTMSIKSDVVMEAMVKAGLEESKRGTTQNYINKLVQQHNKARQGFM